MATEAPSWTEVFLFAIFVIPLVSLLFFIMRAGSELPSREEVAIQSCTEIVNTYTQEDILGVKPVIYERGATVSFGYYEVFSVNWLREEWNLSVRCEGTVKLETREFQLVGLNVNGESLTELVRGEGRK